MAIRIGLYGYGNIARGAEAAIAHNKDMELIAVFTRRNPRDVSARSGVPVYSQAQALSMTDKLDVMIMCGGSATDLPAQSPQLAAHFNIVDSFDTHAKIPEHFNAVDAAAKKAGKTALISSGWDPGLFSLNRLLGNAVLPGGKAYTFWGRGVSQGHSDAIRRIDGVKDARQYTVPVESALEAVRNGETPDFSPRQMHLRECWVVADKGADKARIEREIKQMPDYFADYDTTVTFISEEELKANHSAIPHGGFVLRSGKTGFDNETSHLMEFSLKLDSNPEFSSSVLVCCARAVYRLNSSGSTGCKTIFDVPPGMLCPESPEELRAKYL